MRVWGVWGGKKGGLEKKYLLENRIYLVWGLDNLEHAKNEDDIRKELKNTHPKANDRTRGQWLPSIKTHRFEMQIGDFVIMPFKKRKEYVAIGKITSDYIFDEKGENLQEDEGDFRHYREVKWLNKSMLKEDLREELGKNIKLSGRRTFFTIGEAEVYKSIEKILKKTIPNNPAYIICYYFARFNRESLENLGFASFSEAFEQIAKTFGVSKDTLGWRKYEFKNLLDGRTEQQKYPNRAVPNIKEALKDYTEQQIRSLVIDILENPEGEKNINLAESISNNDSSKKNVAKQIREVVEGGEKYSTHKVRERNPALVKEKKQQAKEKGTLACEACGFDFVKKYGSHGEGFIECHHIKPLHTLKKTSKTKLEDLALLCANCHRMIHRKLEQKKYMSVGELKKIIRSQP